MELRAEVAVEVPAEADATAAAVDTVGQGPCVGLEHGPRLLHPLAAGEHPLECGLAVSVPEGVGGAPILHLQAASLLRASLTLGGEAAPALLQLPARALIARECRDPDLGDGTAAVRLLLLATVQQAHLLALARDVRELEEPGVGPPRVEGAEHGGLDVVAHDEGRPGDVLSEERHEPAAQLRVEGEGDPTTEAGRVQGVGGKRPKRTQLRLPVAIGGKRHASQLVDNLTSLSPKDGRRRWHPAGD
eukprot:scaffold2547_cov63-Phaeocystis_antarctica.AAC.4